MTSRTILLVDDDEDLRSTLVEQLSLYEEFDVLQEPSATKGVQAARAGGPPRVRPSAGRTPRRDARSRPVRACRPTKPHQG